MEQRARAAAFLARRGDHAEALALAAKAFPDEPIVVPELDDEVTSADRDRLDELLERMDAATERRTPRAVWIGLGVVAAIAAIIIIRKPSFTVTASASADAWLAPKYAIDGDLKTEWALPDGRLGHIDVVPAKPRHVARVRLLNSMNLPGADRGTRAFTVEVFANGAVVKTASDTFATYSREPSWRTIELDVPNVERVRVRVESFHGSGGGLAEIAVE